MRTTMLKCIVLLLTVWHTLCVCVSPLKVKPTQSPRAGNPKSLTLLGPAHDSTHVQDFKDGLFGQPEPHSQLLIGQHK